MGFGVTPRWVPNEPVLSRIWGAIPSPEENVRGSPSTHLGPLFTLAFFVLELTDENLVRWPQGWCPWHSGLQRHFLRKIHIREKQGTVWLHCKQEARVHSARASSHPTLSMGHYASTPRPHCVTLGLQVHKDRGPERFSFLCSPDEEFVSHGELFPGNGHPALPGRHLHLMGSIGMAVRKDAEKRWGLSQPKPQAKLRSLHGLHVLNHLCWVSRPALKSILCGLRQMPQPLCSSSNVCN